jgi:ATP-binding cassette subfamily B protein
MLLLGIPAVILPIVFLGREIRDVSRSSQDRVADVGAMVDEVLGAMKIVQSFNQQGREASRFEAAVESVFGTARRRILLRCLHDRPCDRPYLRSDHPHHVAGRARRSGRTAQRRNDRRFVLTGGLVAGAFGALTKFTAISARRRARPGVWPS